MTKNINSHLILEKKKKKFRYETLIITISIGVGQLSITRMDSTDFFHIQISHKIALGKKRKICAESCLMSGYDWS